jgi:hypothetical protein
VHTLFVIVLFFVMLLSPCVSATMVDLDAEEAFARERESIQEEGYAGARSS